MQPVQPLTDNFLHGSAVISNHSQTEGVLGADGLRISQVSYVKSYLNKSIRGVGEVQLQYRYRMNGETDLVGFELFSGAIGERNGSLIFELTGTINSESGVVSIEKNLKYGSGSAEFYACSGKGSYEIAKDGRCSFELTLYT